MSTKIPLAAVKRVMKEDPEVIAVSNGAVAHMDAATNLFIAHFAEQAALSARLGQDNKRLSYKDFAAAVKENDNLQFLGPLVPPKVPFQSVFTKRVAADLESAPGNTPIYNKPEEMEDETQ